MIDLYQSDTHRNVMWGDLGGGTMVQANQHVIVDHGEGILLDPGGHKVYSALFAQMTSAVPINKLRYVFFSHQDPDIVAAANGWLMVTDAMAYVSALWMRFIPHFGVDKLAVERMKPIPDEGMVLRVGEADLLLIPAHFLHSSGNFQVYDPVSKFLYTGDLGASLGTDAVEVDDFDEHVKYLEGFHKRYIPTGKALKMWARTVAQLDVEALVPQHGAMFRGKEMVARYVDWVQELSVGLDIMGDQYPIPGA